jgi:8-oxo-dGTP pyrophosphatase MutT (NUDIX family)
MTREEVAAAFTASIAHLNPISDREGQYNYAPVRVRTYIADIELPEAIASSVRAVVLRGRAVVVVRHWDGYRHVIPGGRREQDETIEQTVRREVLEESGWHVGTLKPLGFEHLQHLGEPPPDFPVPFSFINPIFVAEGVSFDRSARDLTQSEAGSSLVSIARALRELPGWETALLRAAVAARQPFDVSGLGRLA